MRLWKFYIALVFGFACLQVEAQPTFGGGLEVMMEKGDRFFEEYKYAEALEQYERAARLRKKDPYIKVKVAETYLKLHDNKKAEEWYTQAFATPDLDVDDEVILHYAQILRNNEKYAEAKKWFKKYDDRVGGNSEVKDQLFFIDNLNYYYKDSTKFKVNEVGFNSAGEDFAPTFSPEGIFFVSNRHERKTNIQTEQSFVDIYSSDLGNDSTPAEIIRVFGKRRQTVHEGPVAFFPGGNRALFTRTVSVKLPNGSTEMKLKLFENARDTSGKWDDFQPVNLVAERDAAGHPTLTSDGKTMYFVSDQPGGQGETDIYRASWNGTAWGEPENLGHLINSPGKELFPFIYQDSILYFASSGHPGLGGLDVFKVELSGEGNKVPVNLGIPINSNRDDFGFVLNEEGEEGYFSSNRTRGTGGMDIYHFEKERIKRVILEGFTKDKSNAPLNIGHVLLVDDITKEKLGRSDASGYFKLELENNRDYSLVAKATAKPTSFDIHFEGFVKDRKDTSHIIKLEIFDHLSKEQIFGSQEGGYMKFNMSEGVDYEMRVQIESGENIDINDIHFEGFVTNKSHPHVNLGEVRIMDAYEDESLFKSDKNGFFNFHMENNRLYLINAQRRSIDEFFELVFEGFVQHKKDTSQQVDLAIIDPESGEAVYRSDKNGYSKFIIEKDKNYSFKARLKDSTEVDVGDLHFEGFVKGLDIPIIISEAKIIDKETKESLFKSDAHGFFTFDMQNNKEYSLVVKKRKENYKIWFEGFLRNEGDSIAPSDINILDPETGRNIFEGYDGYFGFELEEGVPYDIHASIDTAYDRAEKINFEGFVTDAEIPVGMGKVTMFDARTDQVLFETDDIGFFSFEADPDEDYEFVARKVGGDSTENVKIRFSGFIKDEKDSLTHAKFKLIDPETGDELLSTDFKGYFSFDLDQNKVYKVEAIPNPIRQNVLHRVGLIVVTATDKLKQLVLIDQPTGKLYEVNLDSDEHYYTDGIITRKFSKNIHKEMIDIESIVEFFEEDSLKVVDTIEVASIYYPYNSHKLLGKNKTILEPLVRLMKENPSINLVISSHADSRGSKSYNQRLTAQRNASIIHYLVMQGIEDTRIKDISYGEFHSLEHCMDCDDTQHQLNRRTDFHILSY